MSLPETIDLPPRTKAGDKAAWLGLPGDRCYRCGNPVDAARAATFRMVHGGGRMLRADIAARLDAEGRAYEPGGHFDWYSDMGNWHLGPECVKRWPRAYVTMPAAQEPTAKPVSVTIVSAADAGLDRCYRWYCSCERHNTLVGVATKREAQSAALNPAEWCEEGRS